MNARATWVAVASSTGAILSISGFFFNISKLGMINCPKDAHVHNLSNEECRRPIDYAIYIYIHIYIFIQNKKLLLFQFLTAEPGSVCAAYARGSVNCCDSTIQPS